MLATFQLAHLILSDGFAEAARPTTLLMTCSIPQMPLGFHIRLNAETGCRLESKCDRSGIVSVL